MKPTQIYYGTRKFFEMGLTNETLVKGDVWVPSRPMGGRWGFFRRLYPAWLVFIGKADALIWLEDHYSE